MNLLPNDLISRICARASDPETRTDASPTTRGRTVSVGGWSVQGVDLGAVLRGDPNPSVRADASPLAAAVRPERIAAEETQLGFALPDPLRQLYAEVADGGFGPGAGLLTLTELVRTYRHLRANPPGVRGQPWPPHLLPITWTDPGYECIDTQTGKIVFWDEESLADGPSDKVWKRSFKAEAADLASWFEKWVGTPSPEAQMKASMQSAMNDGIRASLNYWRSKTPEERAAFGLPEEGWEQALFGHLGIDLSKL